MTDSDDQDRLESQFAAARAAGEGVAPGEALLARIHADAAAEMVRPAPVTAAAPWPAIRRALGGALGLGALAAVAGIGLGLGLLAPSGLDRVIDGFATTQVGFGADPDLSLFGAEG